MNRLIRACSAGLLSLAVLAPPAVATAPAGAVTCRAPYTPPLATGQYIAINGYGIAYLVPGPAGAAYRCTVSGQLTRAS
jgi:hypothetical protein